MVFFDAKCNQCGEYLQVIYNPKTDLLRDTECINCGAKLDEKQIELICHHMDGLTSVFSRSAFQFKTITILSD